MAGFLLIHENCEGAWGWRHMKAPLAASTADTLIASHSPRGYTISYSPFLVDPQGPVKMRDQISGQF